MGYYMTQRDAIFHIKKENVDKALQAIKDLADPEKMKGNAHGGSRTEIWYSWVTTSEFVNAGTLKDAIRAWRWEVDIDDEGNVCHLWFEGEKLGDDAVLFEALAPYVEDGGYIEMSGEDGALWRWDFNNKSMTEQFATVRWD